MYLIQVLLYASASFLLFLLYQSQGLKRQFKKESITEIHSDKKRQKTITKEDIAHLPPSVQRYMKYVGVIGKDRVQNMWVEIEGQMKFDQDKDWTDVQVLQYSTFENPKRMFYITTKIKGLPVKGLHSYKIYKDKVKAIMEIKLLGVIPVVHGKGQAMNQGETVTFLNDICVLAPATLIDPRLSWKSIDENTAEVTFQNKQCKVSAWLIFNKKGQLINFLSKDRFYSTTGDNFQRVPWSTPIKNYKENKGYTLATYGEGIWELPGKKYPYAKFNFKNLHYNL